MRFVLGLAEQNVVRGTGGPFAAAVFAGARFELVAVGVNIVLAAHSSVAHAEMVALTMAQQRLGSHDLGLTGRGDCELVTSVEPCAMCLGAVPWSGVRRLVCGARDADARVIGFDEGQKPRRWVAGLRERGVEVVRDVLRGESAAQLEAYRRAGGAIYNSTVSCGRR
jgi:tRNA(Arg) A34 adenosine deaminase TadA